MQIIWELYDANGNFVNRITASDENYVKDICEVSGWSYKALQEDKSFVIPEQPNPLTLTNEKIKALDSRQDFIEDCIAEMATQVYKED